MTREVRRSVERLKFEAVHANRPGVQEMVFSCIETRAMGECRVWEEYERLAGNHGIVKDPPFPLVNHGLNRANQIIKKARASQLLLEKLDEEFFK